MAARKASGRGLPVWLIGSALVGGLYAWSLSRVGGESAPWQPAQAAALLGTDEFGRDLAAVVILSGVNSLSYGLIVSLVALVLAALLAYGITFARIRALARAIDLAARVVDGVPVVMWVLLLALLTPGAPQMVATIVFLVAVLPYLTRVLAGEFSRLADEPYVEAARLQELAPSKLLRVHLLPHAWAIVGPSLAQVCGLAVAVDAAIALVGSANRTELNLGVLLLRAKEQYAHPGLMAAALVTVALIYLILLLAGAARGAREPVL